MRVSGVEWRWLSEMRVAHVVSEALVLPNSRVYVHDLFKLGNWKRAEVFKTHSSFQAHFEAHVCATVSSSMFPCYLPG